MVNQSRQPNINDRRDTLPARFFVGEWQVDVNLLSISRDSTQVTLEPKMMAVLVYLAEAQGKCISREELEQVIWSGSVVSYDALTSTINKLRKAFGDDSTQPIYIRTVPKKGYCLIAAVSKDANTPTEVTAASGRMPKRPGWFTITFALLVLLAVALTVLLSESSIEHNPHKQLPTLVVLPFDDLSQENSHSYFSDGITADITTALSKLSGLFVISWSSATTLQGNTSRDILNVAQTLNVRYVLQGNLRRTQNRVRINVQLIDASNGVNLWAERYDREITTVLDLQDEIAGEIAAALSIKLTEQEKLRQSRRYTTNINAYDKFLQGQAAYVRSNRDDNFAARNLFQAAIDIDPNFARAYSALALTYADESRFQWSADPIASLAQALQLANKAVTIDDQLPQAYWVLAYVYLQKRDYALSIENAQRAIELDPNNSDAHAMLALSKMHDGDPLAAIRLVNKAMNLNPNYPARYASLLGQAYYYQGKYEEAIYALRDATRRNIELITPRIYLIAALEKSGNHDEATWEANQLKVSVPGFSVDNIQLIIPFKEPAHARDIQQQLIQAGL